MSRSDPTLPPLSFEARLPTYTGWDETTLTVFDGHGAVRGSGFGVVSLMLPRGLYTIRAERFGELQDTVVLHEIIAPHVIPFPTRNSAMPASDTLHTHEFFQGPGSHYSRTSTVPDESEDLQHLPRLMIMVRGSGERLDEAAIPDWGLALFSESGALVTRFEPEKTARDTRFGWMVYSAHTQPGNYMLTDTSGARDLSMPLRLEPGWDLFVFVPFEVGKARLSAASIDIARKGNGYDALNPLTQQIDAVVQGLGARLDQMSPSLTSEALSGKFDHPFLGLIGAHAHFLGPRRKFRLERAVLANLWSLMPGSPDVIALLLLALERGPEGLPKSRDALSEAALEAFGDPLDNALPLTFPPMLRAALNVLTRASRSLPGLIAPGSWLEASALSATSDGAWAVWDQAKPQRPRPSPQPSPLPSLRPSRMPESAPGTDTPSSAPAIVRTTTSPSPKSARRGFGLTGLLQPLIDPLLKGIVTAALKITPIFLSKRDDSSSRIPLESLMRRINERKPETTIVSAEPSVPVAPPQTLLRPQIEAPDWLTELVQIRLSEDGDDFDAAVVAELADVPMGSVERVANALRAYPQTIP